MSLEQQIEANTAAIVALTAALKGAHVAATSSSASTDAPAPKRGPGRPKKEEAAPKPKDDDADLGLGDDDDGLGLGDDEAPAFTFGDIKKLMTELRDIGGPAANKGDCKKVMEKFGLGNFMELDGQEDKYNAVADYIKKAIAARKAK